MNSNAEPTGAIPFIILSKNKGFEVTREAEAYLATLEGRRLGVVSIAGKYRTGKSYLLNKLIQRRAERRGFEVGPTVNSCTKGIWLWPQTFRSENPDEPDLEVVVLDTEGFGGINESQNHDNRIFIFSLLLSSLFIYNSVGSIDENALQTLSLIVNFAKNIQLGETRPSDSRQISESLVSDVSNDVSQLARLSNAAPLESEEAIVETFPFFLWVIRDFCLELKDSHGNPITSKAYFENALKTVAQTGPADGKNKVRSLLKHFFRSRDCVTMVRPVEREADLQNLDNLEDMSLRPEFVLQVKKTRKMVFMKAGPKKIRGSTLDGPRLVQLARAYVQAVNSGAAPSVDSAWNYIVQFENEKKLRVIYSKLRVSRSVVRNQGEIDSLIESVFVDFDQERIGSGEETNEVKRKFEAEIRQELEHDCSRFAESLRVAVREKAEDHVESLKKAVMELEAFDSATLERLTEQRVQAVLEQFKGPANPEEVRGLTEQLFARHKAEVLQLALRQMERVSAREAKEREAKKEESERKLREDNEHLLARVDQLEQEWGAGTQKVQELLKENQKLEQQVAQLQDENKQVAGQLRSTQGRLDRLEAEVRDEKDQEISRLVAEVESLTAQLAERDSNAQKESVLLNGKLKYLETNLQKTKLEVQAREAEAQEAKKRAADSERLVEEMALKLKTQKVAVPDTQLLVEKARWAEMLEKVAAGDDLKENYEKVIREVIEERNMIQGQFEFLRENFELEKNKNFRLLNDIHDKIAKKQGGPPEECRECPETPVSAHDPANAVPAGPPLADEVPEISVTNAVVVRPSGESAEGQANVMYCLDVHLGARTWSLQKRFRDVFDLAVKLRRGLKRLELPPSTKELWGFTKDIWGAAGSKSFPLEQRKILVEKVLRDLAALRPVRAHPSFVEFLRDEQFKD